MLDDLKLWERRTPPGVSIGETMYQHEGKGRGTRKRPAAVADEHCADRDQT